MQSFNFQETSIFKIELTLKMVTKIATIACFLCSQQNTKLGLAHLVKNELKSAKKSRKALKTLVSETFSN